MRKPEGSRQAAPDGEITFIVTVQVQEELPSGTFTLLQVELEALEKTATPQESPPS